MIRSTAVRLGIPVRQLAFRILIPFGLILLVVVGLLSFMATNNLHERALYEQQVTVKTLFETQASVHASRNGLAVLSQNRGYERVWVLSATGDILDSNKNSDIGTQLDSRWWNLLKDEESGFIQQDIDFGNQQLSLTALHHAEMGRWVVIVSKPKSTGTLTLLYSGLILVIGLILWLLTAALIWGTLSRKIDLPLKKLDDRTVDLIRGSGLTDAALDRLLAETLPSLGGHADCVVDLARKMKLANDGRSEMQSQFNQLFDSIPSWVFIASNNGVILKANRSISQRLGVETAWIEGQSVHMLKGIAPVKHLERWFSKESASKVGIERIEIFPSTGDGLLSPIVLTVQPMLWSRTPSYLVVIEEKSTVSMEPDEVAVSIDQDLSATFSMSEFEAADSGSSRSEHDSKLKAKKSLHSNPVQVVNERDRKSKASEMKTSRSPLGSGAASGRHESDKGTSPGSSSIMSANLLEGLMEATGQFVVVFNEEARTILWSPTARSITGLALEDIPDMKAFTDKVFTSRAERKLFKDWIDGEPDERSQELKIKSPDGILTSRWYASEIDASTEGSVGVLWAELDTPFFRKRSLRREPVAQ
ncbi:PAS domain-containing protein [bacterium]|nr:PAS domain-containing protein [bacterium]